MHAPSLSGSDDNIRILCWPVKISLKYTFIHIPHRTSVINIHYHYALIYDHLGCQDCWALVKEQARTFDAVCLDVHRISRCWCQLGQVGWVWREHYFKHPLLPPSLSDCMVPPVLQFYLNLTHKERLLCELLPPSKSGLGSVVCTCFRCFAFYR
jgi:hypothetical protein